MALSLVGYSLWYAERQPHSSSSLFATSLFLHLICSTYGDAAMINNGLSELGMERGRERESEQRERERKKREKEIGKGSQVGFTAWNAQHKGPCPTGDSRAETAASLGKPLAPLRPNTSGASGAFSFMRGTRTFTKGPSWTI